MLVLSRCLLLSLLLSVLLAGACETTPATQVLVRIDADSTMRGRAAALRVRVFSVGETEPRYDGTKTVGGPAPELTFPATVPVVPAGGDPSRAFRIVAELLDSAGAPFATEESTESFIADTLREITLTFRDAPTDGGVDGDAGPTDAATDAPPDAPTCDCPCADDTCDATGCVPSRPIIRVGTGLAHACAVDGAGVLLCWGNNAWGQLGVGEGDHDERATPAVVTTTLQFVDIDPSDEFTCGLTTADQVWCWGRNRTRSLGTGPCCENGDEDTPALTEAVETYTTFSTGTAHGCAVGRSTSGRLFCWGDNRVFQCGNDTMTSYAAPRPTVDFETDWQWISAGGEHTCAIKTTGALYCWGKGANGRLGNGGTTDAVSKQRVAGTWRSVDAGLHHTCAIDFDGLLQCWGRNAELQLGTGDAMERRSPTSIGTDSDWQSVSAGATHTCGLRGAEGRLFCWGTNVTGQLGIDSGAASSSVPVEVGPGWASVSAGNGFTCAVTTAGALFCWGSGGSNRLGLGDASERRAPTRVCLP
jgi:alpha-tubulin suppressor-like RCC1 family protein